MNFYLFLADMVVFVHAVYMAVVVLGLIAILAGAAQGWRWIRSVRFRLIHLAMIGIVAVQALLGLRCPLTVLENHLRRLGGGPTYSESFIGHWSQRLLFYEFPPWVFTVMHVGFALLVLVTLLLIPPRWAQRGAA